MPTLDWENKSDALRAVKKIPYRLLEFDSVQSCGDDENFIVQGDNLDALNSLLPFYRGRVKCIYIDPPYNTHSAFEHYDDNFEHAEWLSMMYPRLELLRDFLSDDGAIFISIDDEEAHYLKVICDEIFGRKNFVAQFNWRRRSGANDALNNVSLDHEYVICYAKVINNFSLNGVEKSFANYANPDNDPRGEWMKDNLTCGKTATQRPNLFYPITDPKTGITYECNPDHVWRFERSRMQNLIVEGKIIFPPNGKGRPAYKRHRSELRSETKPFSSIIDTPLNTTATRELREIFGRQVFDYPKTVNLIQQIVNQATEKNSLVLDAFAGSGTTAHAVINLNETDGGARKFILIEEKEYCKTITAERVRRVGGSFKFFRVGAKLFDETGALNPSVTARELAAFIWFKFTGRAYPSEENLPLIGIFEGAAYYLASEPLTKKFLATLPAYDGQKIIFGATSRVSADFLSANKIIFKQLPSEIKA